MQNTPKTSRMKKWSALILSAMLAVTMTACARSGGAQPNNNAANPADGATTPAASSAEYVIKVAHVVDQENSLHKGFLKFQEYVEKESGGRIGVEIFSDGLMGGDRDLVEGVELGTLHMTAPASTVLVQYAPDIGILDMPFLFPDAQAGFTALDGELGNKINDIILDKVGVYSLGYAYNGARAISNNVRPITKPEDMNGIKVRVMESPVYIDTFKAMGANPTPMSFGEVFTALQQGTIDGQDNAAPLTVSARFFEAQKYFTNLGHTQSFMPLLMNVQFFDSLPEDLQGIVRDGVKVGLIDAQRQIEIDDRDAAIQTMIDFGSTQVDTVSSEDYKKFEESVQSVYDKYRASIDPVLFELAGK